MKKEYIFQKPIVIVILLFSITIHAQSVVINEIVTDPQSDWSSNSFNGIAGSGTVSQGVDEYIELYIKTDGLNLTNWTIELNDSSPVTGDLTDSGAFSVSNYISSDSGTFNSTTSGDFLVLGNVVGAGSMNNSITILLKDNTGTVIDSVILGGGSGEAFSGNAATIGDEAVFRMPNGIDTNNNETDFSKGISSLGITNLTHFYWDGSLNTDWANTSNWATGELPGSDDNVFIPNVENKPVIHSSTHAVIQDLDVTSSSLTINNGSLRVNGVSNGNLTYTRNLATSNWYLIGTPLHGITFNDSYVASNAIDSGTDNNLGIASYDTTLDNWDYLQVGKTINPTAGQGFAVKRAAAGLIEFSGTIRTTDVLINLNEGSNGSYNLISNPYTSSISSASFLQDNSDKLISQTLWVWNESTGAYQAKVAGENFVIAPTQGFFVRANGTNAVTIKKSYQTNGGIFQKSEMYTISMTASDGNQERSLQIYFTDDATKGFDNGWDGELFKGQNQDFSIASALLDNDNEDAFQIQGLPTEEINSVKIPILVSAKKGQEILFSIHAVLPDGIQVYLEDTEADSLIRLDEAGSFYQISLSKDINDKGRFYLHTSEDTLSSSANPIETSSLFYTNGKLIWNGLSLGICNLRVVTVLGKEIISLKNIDAARGSVRINNLKKGLYIVTLHSKTEKITRKIIIQ